MSTSLTPTQVLNGQIIRSLCSGIMTESTLLNDLVTRYPLSNWTLSLLQDYLLIGSRQGRYLRVARNPDLWQIRPNMGVVNPTNQVYQSLCPTIRQAIGRALQECGP